MNEVDNILVSYSMLKIFYKWKSGGKKGRKGPGQRIQGRDRSKGGWVMSRMMAEIRPQNQSGEAPLLPPLPPKAPLYCCQAPSTVVTLSQNRVSTVPNFCGTTSQFHSGTAQAPYLTPGAWGDEEGDFLRFHLLYGGAVCDS